MTMPGGGGSFDLAQQFGQLVNSIQGLQTVISQQTSVLERTASAEARYQVAGLRQPQISQSALQLIQSAGGMTQGMNGPAAQMTALGALASVQNLQVFASQRVGSWLAGVPLFQQQGQGGGMPSVTPQGTPSSAGAQAGAGAQQAAPPPVPMPPNAPGGPQVDVRIPSFNPFTGQPYGGGGGGAGPPGGGGGRPVIGPGPAPLGGGGGGRTAGIMQLAGSRIAMSGGAPGGLYAALRGLPGVGLVMDLLGKGTSFFQGQWEAGRYFQEAEGGTNLGGQAERLHQAIYQASMALTPMGSKAAGEAFDIVSQLGYNRASTDEALQGGAGPYAQDRQGALNFIYHNFTQNGMSVQQSAQFLQEASQNSQISLGNLTKVLEVLGNTAGKAGANADQARQQFEQYFQTAIQTGAGPGAPQLAGAVAATQASYGKQFAGTSFAGELSQGRQYLLAGQYGILPAQAQYLARNNPSTYANMLAGQNLNFIENYLGLQPADLQYLRQLIQQNGGGAAISPDIADRIAQQWLNWGDAHDPGAFNVDVWAQLLSSLTGIQLTPANVAQWVVMQVAGKNEASQAARLPKGTASTGGGAGASVPASNTSGAPTGQYGLARTILAPSGQGRMGALAPAPGQAWQQVLTGHAGSAAQAYLAEERKSGRRSPVLEALLQNLSSSDKVQVQTRNGPRVMSLTDAMKYYPDELMNGSVMFFSADGRTLLGSTSQITHGLTANENLAPEERQAAGSNLGVSAAQWRRQHGSTYMSAQTGRSITIDLTGEAKQLLKVLPGNNDTAAASGTVPAVPWPSVSSR